MPIFVKSSLPRLVLASASPRRLDICHSIGLKPIVITGSCQEVQEGLPTAVVCENSRRKALAAASLAEPQDLLIASDTIVVRGEQILGKPRNQEDACAMLLSLKNSWHQVYSGLALLDNNNQKLLVGYSMTEVFMRDFSMRELEAYLACGEPLDKAGSYGIQGRGSLLIGQIKGDYNTVVGMSCLLLEELLAQMGWNIWDFMI